MAKHVLSLPANDERILELTTLGVREGMFMPFAGHSAEYAIGRFRFHEADDDCEKFLTSLVQLLRDDALRFAREHGPLVEEGPPG